LKKIFAILFITATILFSSNLKTEEKIYNLIIHALLPHKKEVKVWGDTQHNQKVLRTIPNTVFVDSPKEADFLLLNSKEHIANNKGIIFITNFKLLEKMHKKAIGGFFWQKGRPNILFLRQNLKKRNITLPKSMQDYIEDEI